MGGCRDVSMLGHTDEIVNENAYKELWGKVIICPFV